MFRHVLTLTHHHQPQLHHHPHPLEALDSFTGGRGRDVCHSLVQPRVVQSHQAPLLITLI